MDDLRDLLDKLPLLIALLAWAISLAFRRARRERERPDSAAPPQTRPPARRAEVRWPKPTTGGAPEATATKGYRPIEPR